MPEVAIGDANSDERFSFVPGFFVVSVSREFGKPHYSVKGGKCV